MTPGGKRVDVARTTSSQRKPKEGKRGESVKRLKLSDEADSAKVTSPVANKNTSGHNSNPDQTLTNLTIDMNFEDTSNLRERRSLSRIHTPNKKQSKHAILTAVNNDERVVKVSRLDCEMGPLVADGNARPKKNLLLSAIDAIEEQFSGSASDANQQSTPKKKYSKKEKKLGNGTGLTTTDTDHVNSETEPDTETK